MNAAAARIKLWREKPAQFVWDNFRVEPDAWQLQALEAFANNRQEFKRISLQACAGPGKSALLAWCGWNFLSCYGSVGNHPKGIAISVTADNLAGNLWPEFAKWQSRSPFLLQGFEWTKSRIFAKDHEPTWFIAARSFSKTANAEEQGRTLSGLHSDYVLVLIDESGEIPVPVVKAGEQALGNCVFGKILQAGNPTSKDGLLYAAASHLSHLWHIIRITGDPMDANRSPRIDKAWAEEQIKTYGRQDPWVKSLILGEFPEGSINSLLTPDEVAVSMARQYKSPDYEYSQKRLGVDCARFGTDSTVILPRQGLVCFNPVIMRGARTNEIAARVAMAKAKWGSEVEFIDGSGGYGSGVIDALIQGGHSPVEVQFAGRPIDPRFNNLRSEMWWNLATWVKRGGALPNMPEISREFTTPTYSYVGGKFQLEPKDAIKKRLGFSPDIGDACALTFAFPDMPAKTGFEWIDNKTNHHGMEEYDPFAQNW